MREGAAGGIAHFYEHLDKFMERRSLREEARAGTVTATPAKNVNTSSSVYNQLSLVWLRTDDGRRRRGHNGARESSEKNDRIFAQGERRHM